MLRPVRFLIKWRSLNLKWSLSSLCTVDSSQLRNSVQLVIYSIWAPLQHLQNLSLEFRVMQNDTAGTDPVVETLLEAADLHNHNHAHPLALAFSWLLFCYVWKCKDVEVPLRAALTYRTGTKDSCSQAGGRRAPLQVKVTAFFCSSLSKSVVKHFSPFLFFQKFSISCREFVPKVPMREFSMTESIWDSLPTSDHAYQS